MKKIFLDNAELCGHCIHEMAKNHEQVALVASNQLALREMAQKIRFFLPSNCQIITFPEYDCLPFDKIGASVEIQTERIAAIAKLQKFMQSQLPFLLLTTLNGFTEKNIDFSFIKNFLLLINIGNKITNFPQILTQYDYKKVLSVANVGEFAHHGKILDIAMHENAYRIQTENSQVKSMRKLDLTTQISTAEVEKIEILPCKELVLNENSINLLKEKFDIEFAQSQHYQHLYRLYSHKIVPLISLFDEKTPIIFFKNYEEEIENFQQSINFYYQNFAEEFELAKHFSIENFYDFDFEGDFFAFTYDKNEDLYMKFESNPVENLYNSGKASGMNSFQMLKKITNS